MFTGALLERQKDLCQALLDPERDGGGHRAAEEFNVRLSHLLEEPEVGRD